MLQSSTAKFEAVSNYSQFFYTSTTVSQVIGEVLPVWMLRPLAVLFFLFFVCLIWIIYLKKRSHSHSTPEERPRNDIAISVIDGADSALPVRISVSETPPPSYNDGSIALQIIETKIQIAELPTYEQAISIKEHPHAGNESLSIAELDK